jgi:hypothetical protein
VRHEKAASELSYRRGKPPDARAFCIPPVHRNTGQMALDNHFGVRKVFLHGEAELSRVDKVALYSFFGVWLTVVQQIPSNTLAPQNHIFVVHMPSMAYPAREISKRRAK